MSDTRIAKLLETRAQSIYREFSVRFLALASESERARSEIHPIIGPWEEALERALKLPQPPTAVYVDAPYTRDEYSRYYHVLETISRYNYPFSRGAARAPDRSRDDYFISPFFTKDNAKVTRELIRIIDRVLEHGLTCIWSYSDRAVADMVHVIESVCNSRRACVRSFATPHRYRAQGRQPSKSTVEYCVIFSLPPSAEAHDSRGRHAE